MHDTTVLMAAILHDTLEDTETTPDELAALFGGEVRNIVMEVTDNKKLKKRKRKELQVKHGPHLTRRARLVKLADKICNLRDVASNPPARWPIKRQIEYFDWAKAGDRRSARHSSAAGAFVRRGIRPTAPCRTLDAACEAGGAGPASENGAVMLRRLMKGLLLLRW